MPGKCIFNDNWLMKDEFADWVEKDDENKFKARCLLCKKSFDIANMGEAALTSHSKSKKHIVNFKIKNAANLKMEKFYENQDKPSTSLKAKESTCPKNNNLSCQTKLPVISDDVLSAEILWALYVIDNHISYNSSKNFNLILQKMCPDSQIAKQFSCGEKKCAYLICFGIAPYLKSVILKSLKQQDGYVLLFDETLNRKLQKKQMDIYIRIWEEDHVVTKYLDSSFLGHSTAEIMLEKLNEASTLNGLPLANIMQLSMDGPNVNWKFFNLLQKQLKLNYDSNALNTGSCGLHIVNGAFKTGSEASGWRINNLFSNMYFHFHDSPARRENYLNVTESSAVPLQFCAHRWVENVTVAERALEIWDNLTVYVKAIKSGKLKDPKNKSGDELKYFANDLLTPAKIACFLSIAKLFQPFLLKYQTDKPMLPFLSDDMKSLFKNIFARFLKQEVLGNCKSISNYFDIDLSDTNNHLDYSKVDVGFSADKLIKSLKNLKKISDREYMQFKMEAKTFLLEASRKLLENNPLRYVIVREISCLNPRKMRNKESCLKKMKNILKVLVENNKVSEHNCDTIICEFRTFLDEVNTSSEIIDFDVDKDRIDSTLDNFFKGKKGFTQLWKILRLLLLMSHGQASVERGFSINKQLEVENLKEESLVAQRLIADHINSVGNVLNVNISKEMLSSASLARKKYMQHLEDIRSAASSNILQKRKNNMQEEIKELKKQKKNLQSDIEELVKSADDFAEEAEKTKNMGMIVKSNSLRKTAKEKKQTVDDLDIELNAKLQELKKM